MNNNEIFVIGAMITLMFGRLFLPEKIFSNKIIANILIPTLIIFLWTYLIVYQSFVVENVFTVLSDSHNSEDLSSLPQGEFLSGQVISGEFTASENFLGIVGFRFWNFYRLNDDYLIFRIRAKGNKEWYYQNKYKSDQFQPNKYFTFGFPVIGNSKGNKYEFEIESTSGETGNAVGASEINPLYIVKYKYSRNLVLADAKSFLNFSYKKLVNLLTNASFTASSFVFLLPLLIYTIFISRIRYSQVSNLSETFLKTWLGILLLIINPNKRNISVALCLLGLLADIFYIRESELSITLLIAVCLYVITVYKIRYHLFYIVALGCLFLSGFLLYFGSPFASERAGAWTWIFLVIWTSNQVWSIRKLR